MGIRVKCPNGHVFKVKDKYAGKRGLCPHCTDKVSVRVPEKSKELPDPSHGESVFDEYEKVLEPESSGSLVGSGSVRMHKSQCKKCLAEVPIWFATCPACGEYMQR